MTSYVGPEMFEDMTPSPGARIGTGFGQGMSEGLQLLVQQKLKSIQQQKQNEALEALGLPANLSPEFQKEFLKQKIKNQESAQNREREKLEKSEEEIKEKSHLNNIIGELEELTSKVGPGKLLSLLTPKGRSAKGEYDTLALGLENYAKEMVGKGVMSKERFVYLTKRLPSSTNTEAKNRGILKGWRKNLKLTEEEFQDKYGNQKNNESKSLTSEIASKFYKMAKGNKEEARELARKHGYNF